MTDQADSQAVVASPDDADTVIDIISDGAHSLIIARFKTMDEALAARQTLADLERTTSLQVDGVMIASCDADGKIHMGEVTDHSTKTGLKWGVVGGVLLGIVFPPSIIAGAVGVGALGAFAGKVRNALNRGGLADDLAEVMKPNTAGIMALVQDTAVVEIQRALDQADEIVAKAIDKQLAADIDRQAAMAKSELASS
jgi:uncharacterized membrane protein